MEKQIKHESQEVMSLSAAQMKVMKNRKVLQYVFKKAEILDKAKTENRAVNQEEEKAIAKLTFLIEALS